MREAVQNLLSQLDADGQQMAGHLTWDELETIYDELHLQTAPFYKGRIEAAIKAKSVDEIGLDQFLQTPLEFIPESGSSQVESLETDRHCHPTAVSNLDNEVPFVRDQLSKLTRGFKRASGYVEPKIAGIGLFNSSDTDVCSSFWTSACGRVNYVLKENNIAARIRQHPVVTMPDDQVLELNQAGADVLAPTQATSSQPVGQDRDGDAALELYPGENATADPAFRDVPDFYGSFTKGARRPHKFCGEGKTRFRLEGSLDEDRVPHCGDPVKIWNKRKAGIIMAGRPGNYGQSNFVHSIGQLYSYMSKRGLRAGVLTTYYHTWLSLADTKGDLQISSMIPYSQKGTESTLSIVEVVLFALLYNIDNPSEPYLGAAVPGGSQMTLNDFVRQFKARTRSESKKAAEKREEKPTEGSAPGGSFSQASFHLGMKIGSNTFIARFGDRLAAIRLASSQEQTEAAQREVQVLTTAKHLQGLCIPELLGYGFLQDGAFFVATSFLEGHHFDWTTEGDLLRLKELETSYRNLHEAGIIHKDVHPGNQLLTPQGVFLIDFAASEVACSPAKIAAEAAYVAQLTTLPVS